MTARRSASFHTVSRLVAGTLVLDLRTRHTVLSSAPKGGGMHHTRFILNHQVPADVHRDERASNQVARRKPSWRDPAQTLTELARRLGVEDDCVGLMTAVPMKQVVKRRVEAEALWVECFATVGVTNAVRASEAVSASQDDRAHGTINLILITNAALASSALVGAVQVATESKTGVLRDQAVPTWTGRPGATGTGTDAVVVACALRGDGPRQRYAGTHTVIGSLIGRVTADCVAEGLARAHEWQRRRRTYAARR